MLSHFLRGLALQVGFLLAPPHGEGGVDPLQQVGVAVGAGLVLVQVEVALVVSTVHQALVEHLARVFAQQGIIAHGVHDHTLLVHHVIVVQHVLAPHVVALLHALLGTFDDAVHERVLHGLALLHAEAVHHLGHALAAAEIAHQVILEREEELRTAGVALAGATTAQLAVNTA